MQLCRQNNNKQYNNITITINKTHTFLGTGSLRPASPHHLGPLRKECGLVTSPHSTHFPRRETEAQPGEAASLCLCSVAAVPRRPGGCEWRCMGPGAPWKRPVGWQGVAPWQLWPLQGRERASLPAGRGQAGTNFPTMCKLVPLQSVNRSL